LKLPGAALIVALGAGACTGVPEARRDLLAAPADAELRSDTLDLGFLERQGALGQRGLGPLEGRAGHGLVWMLAARARLALPFRTASDKELRVRARCHESLGPELTLDLTLNETPVGSLALTPEPQEFRLLLPAAAQRAGDNLLTLSTPRQRRPPPGDPDRRALAVALSELDVRRIDTPQGAAPPRWQGTRLDLPAGAAVAWHLRVPPRARLRVSASAGPARATLRVALADDERGDTLDSLAIASGRVSRVLDLEPWAGSVARLEVAGEEGLGRLEELVLLSPGDAKAPAGALEERPHVVIYLVDTLRADRLGAYGHPAPTSPRFDAFAREALLFEDAWAQASWTRPATGSILTGLHPALHGADREDRALAPEQTTLAELLKAAGYRTGAFVANHLVGGRFGFEQGFDEWNGGDERLYGAPAAVLGERALAWLDRGRGPFLLYVHTLEPHSPYTPEPGYAAPFALPHYTGTRDTRGLLRLGQLGRLAPDGLRFLQSQYQGEIRQNDAAFGALLDGLRARGLLEGSVVVFTSDHGEELLDHGGTEHAKTLYQELLRVPLAVRLPGGRRGGTRETDTVQQIDLLPTLLRLAGVVAPGGLPGRDLAARWLGRDARPLEPPLFFAEERFTVISKAAVRAGARKLILNSDGEALWRAGTPLELYDLARDPGERDNLAARAPVSLRYLRQELERFRRLSAAARKGRTLTLTPGELEQLRALGYVQ
jgi:arylsulfatase A-like enzyme